MTNKPVNVYLGLGANLESPKRSIEDALYKISKMKHTRLIKTSRYYLTSAVEGPPQNDFINSVCMIQTSLSAEKLLEKLQKIEKDLGKVSLCKNGPRKIDIDILFYKNQSIQNKGLTIPHPRWKKRLFVLHPLSDLIKTIDYSEKNIAHSFNIKNLIENFENTEQQKIRVIAT